MMQQTPKSLRLQIGIFGRTNVGKSSFLNMIAGQDVSIISSHPGTTTDVVEKVMELLPVGPVVFLDTAGIDDDTDLSEHRLKKTNQIFDRADISVLVCEPNEWTAYEDLIIKETVKRNTPIIIAVNKIDICNANEEFVALLKSKSTNNIFVSSTDKRNRDTYVSLLKDILIEITPKDFFDPPNVISSLVKPKGIAILIMPIDFEAPKGRLILPQVQAIRDVLDSDAISIVVKETEYKDVLSKLNEKPQIVICDSQVVDKMVAETPKEIKCTTFSILFSKIKGELGMFIDGVRAIDKIKPGDKILIAEACSHHAIEGDIGRVKIPKWIEKHLGFSPVFEISAGRDYPKNLSDYKLIIHCGSCMITRKELLIRMKKADDAGVAITNYGVLISYLHGVLDRVVEPFIL